MFYRGNSAEEFANLCSDYCGGLCGNSTRETEARKKAHDSLKSLQLGIFLQRTRLEYPHIDLICYVTPYPALGREICLRQINF